MTAAIALLAGCKDDDSQPAPTMPIATNDVRANSEMDDITDDVMYIAESESNEEISGRGGGNTFLAGCASITTEQGDATWIRTIDFGTENCTLFTGNRVRGKIILTFTTDFEAQTRTIAYAFDNFYHNDRHVEGDRTVVKRLLDNGHRQATISLNLTVTATDGTVYNRVGERVREFIAGYDTPFTLFDNEFSITGSWVTSVSANGQTYATTINAPLLIKWTCPHIVSGIVTVVRGSDSATALLDYGNGQCDDDATLTINGFSIPISL